MTRGTSRARRDDAWLRQTRRALFAAGLALRLVNAWTPLGKRPFSGPPDDTFYYFSVARELAAGHVPSIDGESPTNGFHPLWMLLLTVFQKVCGFARGDLLPLYVSFSVGALLDVYAAYLLHRILLRLRVSPLLGLLATAAFLLNPYEIEIATWGLESPLALAVSLSFVERACLAPRVSRGRGAFPWALGALGGLLVLSRTDHSVLVAGAVLVAALGRPRAERVGFALRAFGAAFSAVLPWLVYSWLTVGTILQDSSLALAVVVDRMPAAWGIARQSASLFSYRVVASLAESLSYVATFSGVSWGIVLAPPVAIAAALSGTRPERSRFRARVRALAPWLWPALFLFVLHACIRRVFREWYSPPFVALSLVVTASGLDVSLASLRRRRVTFAVGAAGAAALALSWASGSVFPALGFEGWVRGTGIRRGQTDCGALSYFSTDTIVNLDGVVNHAALAALRAGRLLDYAESKHLSTIVVTPQLHSAVFMGPRYRERLVGVPRDPLTFRFATPERKDAAIALGTSAIRLGSAEGRELLSDGWEWPATPPVDRVHSVGDHSELVFFVPDAPGERGALLLDLAADPEVLPAEEVAVSLGGERLGVLRVGTEPALYRIAAPHVRAGRNRIRLDYSAPRAVRRRSSPRWWSGWNWFAGNMVRAVTISSIALEGGAIALPPEGPAFGAPGSASMFASGFLPIETQPDGRAAVWVVQADVDLRFRTSRAGAARALVIEMGPPPESIEGAGQHVRVSLNGTLVGTLELRPSLVERFQVEIPGGVLHDGENVLHLAFSRLSPPDGTGARRAAFLRGIELP
ncbi:MAG TPA: hypothetical protein VHE30_15530 [Polyangiaceae bacterium]|nr:hypothetical protein [Polyangiaceae bacterium]